MPSYEEKSREYWVKKYHISVAQAPVSAKLRTSNRGSEDYLARREIQEFIRELCSLVKTRSKILEILNDTYPDSKYDKYRTYFDTWVSDVLRRMGHKTEEEEHLEDEER